MFSLMSGFNRSFITYNIVSVFYLRSVKKIKGRKQYQCPNEPLVDKTLNTRAAAGKRRVEGGGTHDHKVFAW